MERSSSGLKTGALVFRLVDEWFISTGPVYDKPRAELTAEEKARSLRYQIMDAVDQVHWIPEFGYEREMDWLTICRAIITAHGGWIRAENREGGGSIFSFSLPLGEQPSLPGSEE